MSYEVIFAATPRRDLQRIPPRIVPAIIEFVFGDLAKTPRRVGKPLKGELEGSYSASRGPYRVLYKINDPANRVEILRVDHRARLYRNGHQIRAAG
ncbi:MAG TPA: type II toxin-antitoxin system RelE/ParE family toxin [Dermatophilaceae bacterium]